MSALAEKIKRLAMSTDFYTEVVEILLELESRQPNYTIQMFPTPGPFPAAGPVYPWPSNPSPFTIPSIPSFPTTWCQNSNTNGPVPQSDPTGYVEPSPSNPVGVVVYDRDVTKSLERKIKEDGDNRFIKKPVGYGG